MRCPVCRAENATGPQCRRCRADLSLLLALEERRARLLAEAAAAVARGDGPEAVRLAEGAHGLRDDADARRLIAVGHVLSRNFAAAWQTYAALISTAPL